MRKICAFYALNWRKICAKNVEFRIVVKSILEYITIRLKTIASHLGFCKNPKWVKTQKKNA